MDYMLLHKKLQEAFSDPNRSVGEQEIIYSLFFVINKLYREYIINYEEYTKLVKELNDLSLGAYTDYIDTLVGAAAMNMLHMLQTTLKGVGSAEASRHRSHKVTKLTGIKPHKPNLPGDTDKLDQQK